MVTTDLALLELPFDLLARVPEPFLYRQLDVATSTELERPQGRRFAKPADPLDMRVDAGVHFDVRGICIHASSGPEPGAA